MESMNIAVLSGQISEDADIYTDTEGRMWADFKISTFRAQGKGPDKSLTEETHLIKLANPGTVGKHLRRGKPVMVEGKIIPGKGVMARSVHFPESKPRE